MDAGKTSKLASVIIMALLVVVLPMAARLTFGNPEQDEAEASGAGALTGEGATEPSLVTTVGTKNGGIVEKVAVDEGDLVEADTVLVTLKSDTEALTAAMSELKASDDSQIRNAEFVLDFRKAEYDSTKALYDREVASEQDKRQAFAQYKIAALDVEVAKLEQKYGKLVHQRDNAVLEGMTIRAPSKGFVTERMVDPGEGVQPVQPVMEITTLDPLHVMVNMSDTALGRIKKGDKAEVVIGQLGGLHAVGRVILVSPVVDYASKTFKIKISLPNPDFKIPAGLKTKVIFGKGD